MCDNLDIIVVSTKKRKALIISHLKELNPIISITPDYSLPEGFEPTVKGLTYNHLGTYRCFRGHQDAITKATKDYALIFEDDAVPNRPDWYKVVCDSLFLADVYDLVSFHARGYDRSLFIPFNSIHNPHNFIWTSHEGIWIVAALAYLISKENYERAINFTYDGTPWDLVLYRNFSYCLMEKSPFDHDRSERSLVD